MPFASTSIISGPFAPNGVTTTFPYDFRALSDHEVQVVLTDASGVETILSAGYTVTGVGNDDGGSVVFSPPPASDGRTLTIRAFPDFSQETDFENQGAFNPSILNTALDRAAQRALWLRQNGGVSSGGSGGGGGDPGDGSAVTSVNGRTGAVVLNAAAIGAAAAAHTHAMTDIVGLSAALAPLAPLSSPAFSGNPTAPTQLAGNNSTRLATTAFVSTAVAAALGGGGGGGGGAEPALFSDFGTVDATGATATDNDATITAAEAATDSAIYLPDGLFLKSAATPAFSNLTKAYEGRGKWKEGTSILPARFAYMASKPTTPATQGLTGWFDGDQRFTDGGEYKIIGPNVRTFDIAGPARYFEANTIPHHAFFDVKGGNSGVQAFLTSGAAAGATVITLPAPADASWVGKTVGFANSNGGALTEFRTVTAVNTAGNNITVSAGLTNTYTWNPGAGLVPNIFFHIRTSASFQYNKMTHAGGGDGYNIILRQNVNYVPKATERHTFMAASGGNIGGDTYVNADGVYMQNQEWQLQGQTYDVAAIGYVSSLVRNNDFALDGGKIWIGFYLQSTGTRPIDVGYQLGGAARNGVDFGMASFYETSRLTALASIGATTLAVASANGAHPKDPINLGEPGAYTYTGTIVSISGLTITVTPAVSVAAAASVLVTYGKGGAALNMKLGHRLIWNSTASSSARGGDPLTVFPPFHGNVQGDLIMESGNDGVDNTSDYWAIRFARGANSTTPDTSRIRLRTGGIQIFGTGGHSVAGTSFSLAPGCDFNMASGQIFSFGTNTYLQYNAGTIYLVKNSVVVASW